MECCSKCNGGAPGATGAETMVGVIVIRDAVFGDIIFLAIAPERVSFFAVHSVVTDEQVLLRHAQRDDEPDDVEDEAGDDQVPADDEAGAHQLLSELRPSVAPVEASSLV